MSFLTILSLFLLLLLTVSLIPSGSVSMSMTLYSGANCTGSPSRSWSTSTASSLDCRNLFWASSVFYCNASSSHYTYLYKTWAGQTCEGDPEEAFYSNGSIGACQEVTQVFQGNTTKWQGEIDCDAKETGLVTVADSASRAAQTVPTALNLTSTLSLPTKWVCRALTVDSHGSVWVAVYDGAEDGVAKLAPNGTVASFFPVPSPRGVAVDSAGLIFVTSRGATDTAVYVLNIEGKQIAAFSRETTTLKDPANVVVDSTGALLVADTHIHQVVKLNASTGAPLQAFAVDLLGFSPIAASFTPLDSSVWIGDWSGRRVVHVDADGSVVSVSTPSPRMDQLADLAVDRYGNVFVVDELSGRLVVVAPNGTLAFTTSSPLKRPRAVAVAPNGDVIVYDNAQVQILTFQPSYPTAGHTAELVSEQ